MIHVPWVKAFCSQKPAKEKAACILQSYLEGGNKKLKRKVQVTWTRLQCHAAVLFMQHYISITGAICNPLPKTA